MDFKEQFNEPLPLINKGMSKIYIETPGSCNGSLVVKNDGGGLLSGRIMSNSAAITFDPEKFEGNDCEILFYIDTSMYSIGDNIKTDAVVMSNGGEKIVEFDVKIIPYAIETKEGIKISGLDDFYKYTIGYAAQARQLFFSHEFLMWLYSSGYEYIDLYEKFVSDSNKERALENFLIFNGYKSKSAIKLEGSSVSVKLPPFSKEVYTGNIVITKDDWGYIDEQISLKEPYKWLKLEKTRLQTADFDDAFTAYISFFIDPQQIEGKSSYGVIMMGDKEVSVSAIKLDYIEVKLENKYVSARQESYIIFKNNSGTRLTVDIIPKDSFIKFERSRFFINENAKIPFKVELSAIQTAQVSLMKQPEIRTFITVDTVFNKQPFVKKMELVVGGF